MRSLARPATFWEAAVASWSRIATRLRVPLGFAIAAAYLWLARPAWAWMLAGSAFVAAGLALRAAASGHIRKNRELTTTGPYAYTRNPLYLGSILIAIGFAVAARNLWIALAAVAMFLAIYLPVIRAEEEYLRATFAGYDDYARRVPRFFLRLTPYRTAAAGSDGSYSRALYLKHREYNAALGSLLMMVALVVKLMWKLMWVRP
jgi:protein-S-isoprenylcysteine O-methyltransferase Ste14